MSVKSSLQFIFFLLQLCNLLSEERYLRYGTLELLNTRQTECEMASNLGEHWSGNRRRRTGGGRGWGWWRGVRAMIMVMAAIVVWLSTTAKAIDIAVTVAAHWGRWLWLEKYFFEFVHCLTEHRLDSFYWWSRVRFNRGIRMKVVDCCCWWVWRSAAIPCCWWKRCGLFLGEIKMSSGIVSCIANTITIKVAATLAQRGVQITIGKKWGLGGCGMLILKWNRMIVVLRRRKERYLRINGESEVELPLERAKWATIKIRASLGTVQSRQEGVTVTHKVSVNVKTIRTAFAGPTWRMDTSLTCPIFGKNDRGRGWGGVCKVGWGRQGGHGARWRLGWCSTQKGINSGQDRETTSVV